MVSAFNQKTLKIRDKSDKLERKINDTVKTRLQTFGLFN
jgi:hypothetical protein